MNNHNTFIVQVQYSLSATCGTQCWAKCWIKPNMLEIVTEKWYKIYLQSWYWVLRKTCWLTCLSHLKQCPLWSQCCLICNTQLIIRFLHACVYLSCTFCLLYFSILASFFAHCFPLIPLFMCLFFPYELLLCPTLCLFFFFPFVPFFWPLIWDSSEHDSTPSPRMRKGWRGGRRKKCVVNFIILLKYDRK